MNNVRETPMREVRTKFNIWYADLEPLERILVGAAIGYVVGTILRRVIG